MSDNMIELNKVLNTISKSDNICFFPLRLETHFRKTEISKQLCVRVIPDEILLDYHREGLNAEELEDGKKFWMQWYIASGSSRREYDAWLKLCAKYPIARAAWICRCTKLNDFDDYKKYGSKFSHRPYPEISVIESACENIYKTLGCFSIDEDGISASAEAFQNSVVELFKSIKNDLDLIDKSLMVGSEIVDYLYDAIFGMADYLKRRLDVFTGIYEKFSNLKDNVSFDQLFKKDIQAMNDLSYRLDDFVKKFKDSRITLLSLVDKLTQSMDKAGAFTKCKVLPKKNFEIPEATMLPDRFVFIGEAVDSAHIVVETYKKDFLYGVDKNIKLSIDPNGESKYKADSITGKLTVDPSVQWMFDYETAVRAGMAFTLNIPDKVKGFNYIYVFGVKSKTSNANDLNDLFNGHNYFGESLRLMNPRISTNIVDGDVPENDDDAEKRSRYKIEVDDCINFELLMSRPKENNDAENISELLCCDYSSCWNRVVNYDLSTESKNKYVYACLWDKLAKTYKIDDQNEYLKDFFVNYVRASGKYPSIRVGNLPYGILPISYFEKLRETLSSPNSFICDLFDDLLNLKKKWDVLSTRVPNPSNLKGVDASKDYLEMAGQTPYSISYIQRKEIESCLIEKNTPQISLLKGILQTFVEKGGRAGQPIQDSDEVYDINKSEFVRYLIDEKICPEADAVNYVAEFIDLFTYRLDAWLSGIVNYVLDPKNGVKQSNNNKTQLGAYGWIFDLNEKAGSSSKECDDHFILAPSIQHALSAAVLRSAYLGSKSSDTDSHVCVNLSSMRARQALKLVDGIRSGMSMSVVLGCDLERYLHDAALHGGNACSAEMDRFIYPLRKLFPQLVNFDAEDSRAESYVMQVINGEALLETIINHEEWTWSCPVHNWLEDHLFDEKMAWLRDDELKMDENQRNVFFNIVERLMDSYDALNDLLLSEGVHRLVMGDQASFYAIGNFMANGEGGLPDPEILKTPSEHVVISHKAGMILPQQKEPSEKEIKKIKAFKLVEPSLDAWIESLVGGMEKIVFFVKFGKDTLKECSLGEIGVSASEYLYLSAYPSTFVNYLKAQWCLKNKSMYSGEVFILESADDAEIPCSAGCLSLEEDSIRIQTIRSLLKKSRGMLPSDWNTDVQENKDDEDSIDKEDLAKRVSNLVAKANVLLNSLDKWIASNSVLSDLGEEQVFKGQFNNEQVNLAYGYLCDCVEMGMVNSFVSFNTNAYMDELDAIDQFKECEQSTLIQEDLFNMVKSARDELKRRIEECSESIGLAKDEIVNSSSEKIIESVQKLTLKNVKIFPKFKLTYENLEFGTFKKKTNVYSFVKDENGEFDSFVKKGIKNYSINLNADTFYQWQDEVAEVRDGMKDVHNLSMAQMALDGKSLDASVFQTTTVIAKNEKNECNAELKCLEGYWLGVPVTDEGELRDADSLVLYNVSDFESKKSIVGFIFDGWLEYIPYKKHNAGLVFRCDKPDAEAPQTLLVAVNPNLRSNYVARWDVDSVVGILDTTRQMMMNRAVDPDSIYNDDELSKIFPLFSSKILN